MAPKVNTVSIPVRELVALRLFVNHASRFIAKDDTENAKILVKRTAYSLHNLDKELYADLMRIALEDLSDFNTILREY